MGESGFCRQGDGEGAEDEEKEGEEAEEEDLPELAPLRRF